MARYTAAVCRLCRREGKKLFLKGERCYSGKCAIARRSYAPGQHGQSRKKSSEYGLQLRAKQQARRSYGGLENQFRHYFELAEKVKEGNDIELIQNKVNPFVTISQNLFSLLPTLIMIALIVLLFQNFLLSLRL